MTTTVTLSPFRATGFDAWQGDSTPEQVLADTDDTTWVTLRRGVPLAIEYPAIDGVPGPTVVASVTTKIRVIALDDIVRDYYVGRLLVAPSLLEGGGGRHTASTSVSGSEASPILAGAGSNFNASATFTPLTVDTCSGLVLRIWSDGAEAQSIGIAQATVEVVYDTAGTPTAPTVTVAGPSGVLRPGSAPTVQWTSTTTQRAWQVRVFSAAQYGAGGFDPAVDASTWETGPNGGDRLGVVIPVALDESSAWRAYVRSSDGYQWSAWAYSGWSFASAPTVAVDAVSSAVGHGFDVTWAYTAGAGRQAAAQVAVFASTPADPSTDASLYDSGVLWGSAPFHAVPAWIEDTGTAEVWARVMDSDGVWSAWAGAALTLTYAATTTDAGATAAWDGANGRVAIVLPVCTNVGTAELRRSTDGGTTWTVFADDVTTSASVTTTTYDYRAPLNASIDYEWRQLDGTTDGAGAWTAVATVAVPAGQSWVKHPTDHDLDQAVRILLGAQNADTDATVTVGPVGRDIPIVMSAGRGADELTFDMHVASWADATAVDALARSRVPVLVQRADGAQWWVVVGQQTVKALDGAKGENWAVQWQATEVAEP